MCRRRITLSTLALAAALSCSSLPGARANDYLNGEIDRFFGQNDGNHPGGQIIHHLWKTKLAALAEDILPLPDVFTDYTDANGSWIILDSSGEYKGNRVWTSGMVCGQYWYLFSYTGDEYWLETAKSCTAAMDGTQDADGNDIGFQVLNSYGLGYRLTGNEDYKEQVITGAHTLYDTRYDEMIPAFCSWPSSSRKPTWERTVNVNMIMNLEIMLWSAENGGDEAWIEASEWHAFTAWEDIVRDDNSTCHVAKYDPTTGEVIDQEAYQGASDKSTWSRGQAWTVYGYTMMHRFLPDGPYLGYAKGLLQYFDDNNDEDSIPPSEFDAERNVSNPEDSSATVIVASALFEMFHMTGDPAHLETAVLYLTAALQPTYYEPDADDGWQSILRRASADYDSAEVGAVFGDYYFVESMVRYTIMAPSILLREATAELASISDSSSQLNDDATTVTAIFTAENLVDTNTGTAQAIFTAEDLVDTDFFRMSPYADVFVWYGLTLASTDRVPTAFEIEGIDVTCTGAISAPADGWTVGENTGVMSFEAGTFGCAGITAVGALISFSEVYGTNSTDMVTVNHLILGHALEL